MNIFRNLNRNPGRKTEEKITMANVKQAFFRSMPIMWSYIFVSFAYSMMMKEAGFHWIYGVIISITVYTGAFQFVLITFLSSGASIITVAVTAFLMNSRQSFYSISFLETFKKMGRKKWYMIYNMTDETYAVNCTVNDDAKGRNIMFLVTLFSKSYWVIGTLIGGMLGQLIKFDLTGIDFCMTALFVIIFIDQWENSTKHFPAVLGTILTILCRLIFGKTAFMLPALILVSGILILWTGRKERVS